MTFYTQLQTAMNVQALKQTVAIQMHSVQTLRDLIFVVA